MAGEILLISSKVCSQKKAISIENDFKKKAVACDYRRDLLLRMFEIQTRFFTMEDPRQVGLMANNYKNTKY